MAGPAQDTAPTPGADVQCSWCGHVFEVAQVVRLEEGGWRYACTDCAIRSDHGRIRADLVTDEGDDEDGDEEE